MKIKVVILQNASLHYRLPFYELLGQSVDLKVVHSDGITSDQVNFINKLVPFRKFGPFTFQSRLFREVKSSDVVIGMMDIHFISIIYIFFLCKVLNKRFIWWGGGKGKSKFAFKIKTLLASISDSIIFYSDQTRDEFVSVTGESDSYKVANNSVDIGEELSAEEVSNSDRKSLIFVGSFDRRKRLDLLIDGYSKYREELKGIEMVLVGDGDCFSEIQSSVHNLGLEGSIKLIGRINDPAELALIYKRSLVSLSYGQAGLSILQSLGNGVPFITTFSAISGGEIAHIRDGITGYLVDDNIDSFFEYILLILRNEDVAVKLRLNALAHFRQHRSLENMVASFLRVINEK